MGKCLLRKLLLVAELPAGRAADAVLAHVCGPGVGGSLRWGQHYSKAASPNSLEWRGAEDKGPWVPQICLLSIGLFKLQFPREPRAELVLRVGQGTVGHMSRAWLSAWQPSWYLGLGPESSFGIPPPSSQMAG